MKKTKIAEIINGNVFSKSEVQLQLLGFHLRKKEYIAEIDEKTHKIRLGQNFILFYDESTDELFLCFEVDFETILLGYDKWYIANISENDNERGILQFEYLHFYLKINHSEYGSEDFHPSSKSIVITDTNVESKLKNKDYSEKFYKPFEYVEFNVEKFIEITRNFVNSEIDYRKCVEENFELLKFKCMPMYLKQIDWATKIFLENFDRLLNLYRNANDKTEKENLFQFISRQRIIGEKFLNLKVKLPE